MGRRTWDLIFRGMWHFYQVTRDDHLRARELFRQVVAADPSLAEGHTWLGRSNAVCRAEQNQATGRRKFRPLRRPLAEALAEQKS